MRLEFEVAILAADDPRDDELAAESLRVGFCGVWFEFGLGLRWREGDVEL